MYEIWGATGNPPGPHSWWQYDRMFLGWRRQYATFFAQLWAAQFCAAGGKYQPHDMSNLVPHLVDPPAVSQDGMEVLKHLANKGAFR